MNSKVETNKSNKKGREPPLFLLTRKHISKISGGQYDSDKHPRLNSRDN